MQDARWTIYVRKIRIGKLETADAVTSDDHQLPTSGKARSAMLLLIETGEGGNEPTRVVPPAIKNL